jgi:hypothetical protein
MSERQAKEGLLLQQRARSGWPRSTTCVLLLFVLGDERLPGANLLFHRGHALVLSVGR